jgi:hypothetical protein
MSVDVEITDLRSSLNFSASNCDSNFANNVRQRDGCCVFTGNLTAYAIHIVSHTWTEEVAVMTS